MASKTTKRRSAAPIGRRDTAPAWKKLVVVLSAPVAMVAAISLLHASSWGVLPFTVLIVAVASAAVWLTAKLLGIRLSLRRWD